MNRMNVVVLGCALVFVFVPAIAGGQVQGGSAFRSGIGRVAASATGPVERSRPVEKLPPVGAMGRASGPAIPAPRMSVPPFRVVTPSIVIMPAPAPVTAEMVAVELRPSRADSTKPTPAPTPVAAVEVGTGTVEFSGLLQAWYAGADDGDPGTFRLRRAEMKFEGVISSAAEWTISVDAAKALKFSNTYGTVGDTRVVTDGKPNPGSHLLQDAFVRLHLGALRVDAGQFKLPIGLEGSAQSSAKIETVERSLFTSAGKYSLVRDLGVMVAGPLTSDMDFQLGVFNGVGEHQNSQDTNAQKAVVGRVVLRTALEGLQVGASGAWGGAEAEENLRRERIGAEARYASGPLTLRTEWMRGVDGEVTRRGYYGLAAYRVGPVEGVVRYDVWDRDVALESDLNDARERNYVAGLSYMVSGSDVKLQANYIRKAFDVAPSSNLILISAQTAW